MEGTGGRVAQATWRVTGGGMAGKGHVQKKKVLSTQP